MKKTSLRTAPVARASRPGIRIKSGVKAGAGCWNHNEALLVARASRPGIRIKSGVKAGAGCWNHNETLLAAR